MPVQLAGLSARQADREARRIERRRRYPGGQKLGRTAQRRMSGAEWQRELRKERT
jgi:hypothetical protein